MENNYKLKKILYNYLKFDEILSIKNFYWTYIIKYEKNNQKYFFKFILKNTFIWGLEYPFEKEKHLYISYFLMKKIEKINKIKIYNFFNDDILVGFNGDWIEGKILTINDLKNKKILEKIASKIAYIHNLTISISNKQHRKRFYLRSFREIFLNNENLISIYEFYCKKQCKNILKNKWLKLFEIYNNYISKENIDRLSFIHWDFWYGNILFDGKEVYFIDFSRILYGEPGLDIGRFLGEIDFLKLKNIKNKFLEFYINFSGDKNIENYIKLSLETIKLFLELKKLKNN